MSNRADRRRDKKALPRYKRTMTVAQRAEALVRHGITPKDIDEAYRRGVEDGTARANESNSFYFCAAIALALNDLYGFGKKRSTRAINLAAQYMIDSFTTLEIVQKAYERVGLEFSNDPVTGQLVEEVEK